MHSSRPSLTARARTLAALTRALPIHPAPVGMPFDDMEREIADARKAGRAS